MALNRRLLLRLAGSTAGTTLVSACGLTPRERENNAILGAIRADPLFTYKPDWVTRVKDQEVKADGWFGNNTTMIRRFLTGTAPATGWAAMVAVSRDAGWDTSGSSLQKVVLHGGSTVSLTLYGTPTQDHLMLDFMGWL